MLRKIFKLLFAPLALIGMLLRWFTSASTPPPVRRASARLANARVTKRLLDEAEEAERLGLELTPTIKPHGPALLPPAAALAQARHLLIQAPAPDLSHLLPDVAEWVREISHEEALKIVAMAPDWLEDHVYARRCAPGLRPVSHEAAMALERERRQDEIDDPAYLDELLRDIAHCR